MIGPSTLEKLKNIGIAVEYGDNAFFPGFAARRAGQSVLLIADRNTRRYA